MQKAGGLLLPAGSILSSVNDPIKSYNRWVDLYKFIGRAQSPSLPSLLQFMDLPPDSEVLMADCGAEGRRS